jgi:hypothetical protein
MNSQLRDLVTARANGRCEYCHFPAGFSYLGFQIDHIIAEKHGGATVAGNLAWVCYYCNTYKGPNIAGWDQTRNQVVRLFNPRKDRWADHFRWEGPVLVGQTEIGDVTINVLAINEPKSVEVRDWLMHLGVLFDES